MAISNQFFSFYRPFLNKICQSIKTGKVSIIVGINSIGKTLLTIQLQSERFQKECLGDKKTHLVFLEFKDKNPPTANQLYKYWLTETAKFADYQLPTREIFNDFSFHFYLSDIAKKLGKDERLVFVLLDFQNIRNQGEGFFKSLIYLHRFTYGIVSYILLSEPHILDSRNVWLQRFIQDFTNYKYLFLKLFDKNTIAADITREEEFLQTKLKEKHYSLISKYSGGLHGVIGALCYFLKNNPEVADVRQLKKIVFADKMYQYWIEDILNSLPIQSVRILKETILNPGTFKKRSNDIYAHWLMELGFLKKDGSFRHPLMLPIVKRYSNIRDEKEGKFRLVNNQFYFQKEIIKLTKNENCVLEKLYKAKGKLVTYDEIGEILWKDDPDKFSLWAISQIVRRLRKKLSFYSINPKIISSQRGEGYILH